MTVVVIFVLLLILSCAIHVCLLIWIYSDAISHDEDPMSWTIMAMVASVLILPFYLMSREKGKTKCLSCGNWFRTGTANCPWCGNDPNS